MSSKEKDKAQKSKIVNSTSNSTDKGKQIAAKSSTKKTLEDYAFPANC